MIQVKIFKDGEEKHCMDCDLLVLTGFKNAENSTETTSCIAGGSGVNKLAVTDGLAKTVAKTICDIAECGTPEELFLIRDFLNAFSKCITQEPKTAAGGQ